MKTIAGILIVLLPAGLAGCDMYTAGTVRTFDNNAAFSRNIADAAAAGVKPDGTPYTVLDAAYHLECFTRTFQNLSDAGHWRPPTYPKAPTTRPTVIPWDNRQ